MNQGERGFYDVTKKFYEVNKSIDDLTSDKLPGAIINRKSKKELK